MTRLRLAWLLPAIATGVWLVAVLASGAVARVLGHWVIAVTMLFGSFLAGSSPEGGGAVAFPVLTKGLHVPAEVARSFGLFIQAVGMSMAMVTIVLVRRPFHRRAVLVGTGAAVVGFVTSVALFGEPDLPFWPMTIPTPWIKAMFSIVLATTALLMVRHDRERDVRTELPPAWTRRHEIGLAVAALAGGFLASLTGTGANIMVFLFLVVLADVSPKMALPTAIMVMAVVSAVGFGLFGVIDGQLDVVVEADRVVRVGEHQVDLVASETDVLGLWLAAVPVVVWGAPLGSWAASRVRESTLVRFVAVLASIEVLTTFVLVDELRADAELLAFLVAGLVVLPAGFLLARRHRSLLFGAPQTR